MTSLSHLLHRGIYWNEGKRTSTLLDTRKGRLIAQIVKDEGDYSVTIFHVGPLARLRMWWNHPHDGEMRPLFYGPLEFSAQYGSMFEAVMEVDVLLKRLGVMPTSMLGQV